MKKANKEKTKFSVLMSIYYKEKPEFLDLALKSIIVDQTLKPDEIIFVEDGPLTKELDEVVLKYEKKYPNIFKVYPLEKNGGLGPALNYGLSKCENELVMRMDTDDISMPTRFEKQIDYMNKHQDVSAVGGCIIDFDKTPEDSKRYKTMPISYDEVIKYAKFRNPINHGSVCFRKSDVLDVGSYQDMFYLEDHYLWARMLINGKKIENLPDVLIALRIGDCFIDRRGNKKYMVGWKKLQNYMYKNKFINFFEKERNLLGMFVLTHCSNEFRTFLYDNIFRKKK